MINIKYFSNIAEDLKKYDWLSIKDIKDFQFLPFEVFVLVDETMVKDIKPNTYFISNYGRMFSLSTRMFLKPKINAKTGYYEYTARRADSRPVSILLHRLLMLAFSPIPNPENYVVNHKDGNKLHSYLTNLEWCTAKENAVHAAKTGLLHPSHGETHVCAKITKKEAELICSLLESRKYQNKQIAEMLGITVGIVEAIRKGDSWVEVSSNYDLTYKKERISVVFSYDELHGICRYFQENPKDDSENLTSYLKKAMIANGIKDINTSKVNSLRKLYKKERWMYVWSNYNF